MTRALLITVTLSLTLTASPSGVELEEYRVKALFLYNFTQFVEWPAESFAKPTDPLAVCVVSPSPFELGELDRALRGHSIEGHPLVSRLIQDPAKSSGCHILFISCGALKKGRPTTVDTRQAGLLIVGEVPGFASAGGAINFFLRNGHVRLEINPVAAEKARLRVSAKLLKLAEIVK